MKNIESRIARLCRVPNASVTVFESIDSTNTEARRAAERGEGTPALIIARHQSAGRGRMGRSFYSPADTGLYMTVLVEASDSLVDTVLLTTAAAVAVARAIENTAGTVVDIKWVNDLYLGGKKICGILCESFETGGKKYVAIGVGVNLYTEDFPAELADIAGSLGVMDDIRAELAADIFGSLWRFYCLGERADMLEYYRARSMVLGKRIVFYENGAEYFGEALDIDEYGRLTVRLDDGSKKILSSGEISLRTLNGEV